MSKSNIPSYIAEAQANPQSNRAAWFKNTAPTYAGVFLWFAFWNTIMQTVYFEKGLSEGIALPIIGVIAAALISHFLFFLAPALYGMKTGKNLYVIGSSSFGAKLAVIMPGLLMGVLQFGWLAVNVFLSSKLLAGTLTSMPEWLIMAVFGLGATFVGLKGIQYVAKISTFLPLIPLGILIYLLVKTLPTLGDFDPATLQIASEAVAPSSFGAFALLVACVLGYFATAGAAGVDIGTAARDKKDIQLGGLVGITGVITIVAGLSILILAGACGNPEVVKALNAMDKNNDVFVNVLMCALVGDGLGKILMFALAFAAFAGGCFSAFIGVNSFRTMMPKISPYASAFAGGAVSVALAITGVAANAIGVFQIVGASFGPICGAMTAEYLLHKGEWSGSRKGVNMAGLLAWAFGFGVGVLPNFGIAVPMATLLAYLIGFAVYYVAGKAGMESPKL